MQKEKAVTRKDFDRTINNRRTKPRKYETVNFIPRYKYNKWLQQVKSARGKTAVKHEPKVAKLLKKFDVITADGVERLAVPNSSNKLVYVPKEELFTVISQVHLQTNHGAFSEMTKHLKAKYKNVSSEAINAYLKLCQQCRPTRTTRSAKKLVKEEDESKENAESRGKSRKGGNDGAAVKSSRKRRKGAKNEVNDAEKKEKPIRPRRPRAIELASTRPLTMGLRTPQRIDFIEMMSCKDYEYNYIVVVREGTTKFVHLRPLRSHSPQELAGILQPIFICFGTPSSLRSSYPEFVAESLRVLSSICPSIPDDIQVEGTEERFFADIETLMLSWVVQNSNERWYAGLRFVQYIANLTYKDDLGKTPFEAMFGRKGKLDVSSLNLPLELLDGIRTEEDPDEERDVDINEMLEVEINDDNQS